MGYHPIMKLGGVLVALASLVGCSQGAHTLRHTKTVDAVGAAPSECQIPVYRSTIPKRPFHEIGVVEAFVGGIPASSLLSRSVIELRKRGCEMNADALIELETTPWEGVIATAVVFDDAPGERRESTPAP